MGPTALLPLRTKTCWGFFRPKNPTASAGCKPANLGTKGQHATSRPTKLLTKKDSILLILFKLKNRQVFSAGPCSTIYGARHHVSLLSTAAVMKDHFVVPKRKYRYIITNSIEQSPSDSLIEPQTEKIFPRFSWNSQVRYRVLGSPINGTYTKLNYNPQRHYWYTF